ncbi:MAG: DUF58 domain-containing protein [Candidatus Sumerlaeia bacterium]|nr:DUF58 domain-containing protein [Candidatus Sumerlaeia bacterium]
MAVPEFIDPKLIGRLEQLELKTNRVFRGRQRGERRSRKRGVSIEFADYRDYARGDDTRHLDWNIYGRLERLFIKLYQEEEDLVFHILLDTSASMDFGTPVTKFAYARQLAAALGYIALANQDKIALTSFATRADKVFRPARGKAQLVKYLRFLDELAPASGTSLSASCRDFAMQSKQSGVVLFISDFLDERGHEEALKHFFARNYEVYAIHLLAKEEKDPPLNGHLELVDAETGEKQEITVTAAVLDAYRKTLEAHCRAIRDWCSARDMTYVPVTTDVPLETFLLSNLRYNGLVT